VVEICVVSPVYGCAECLRALHERLTAVLSELTDSYEIVLVDDRSPDGAWEVLQEIAQDDLHVHALQLSRNFGQHPAITAGLAASNARWTIVMDCDLQDPPEHIPRLLAKAREGYEVVLARRHRRLGSAARRSGALAYYRLYNLISGAGMYANYSNFSILSRRAVEAFLTLRDKDRQYVLIVQWIGFERAEIEVPVAERPAGKSAYRLRTLVRVAADGIFFSTTRLLRWIVYAGFIVACIGLALAVYTGLKYAFGGHVSPFSGISVLVLVMSGFIICSTGVTGLYVGKIFDQVRSRPLYVVDRVISGGVERSGSEALADARVED
jgi:polyisoprenyl-phosphate glycosyltransferase